MEDNKVKEFKVRINKEIIHVEEEVYIAYYKMGRRERYLNEVSLVKDLSYNQLMNQEYPIELKMIDMQELIDDSIVKKIMIEEMLIAINTLTEYEKMIINEIFFCETSIRKLANNLDISKSTLYEQKERILKKLRKIIIK